MSEAPRSIPVPLAWATARATPKLLYYVDFSLRSRERTSDYVYTASRRLDL